MTVQPGRGEIRSLAFPYPVFGRFAYTLFALYVHCCLVFCDSDDFGQCSSISNSVYANSRTPDIGKAEERISPRPG